MVTKTPPMNNGPEIEDLERGILAGERTALARSITLIESRNIAHFTQAQQLLTRLLPHSGRAHRIGITGVPGVGKSTFIERFGTFLTGLGHRVAVLAVDPSSGRSGGSILGDKTRMEKLSSDDNAFIRPSPSAGVLGGVGRATREAMLLCEAAGYDIVLVETVGAGQSEYIVADMVDLFLVLMLPGAGDELQGIKKGVLEIADILAINKADQDPKKARQAARDYKSALHIMTPANAVWKPPVVSISGLTGDGLEDLWSIIQKHRKVAKDHGLLQEKRRTQNVKWMWSMVENRLLDRLRHHPDVKSRLSALEHAVSEGSITATMAAEEILSAFGLPDL